MDNLNVDKNANPNSNFECFMKHFMELKQQCLHKKKVRFNKKMHKVNAWLTLVTLKSINSKNILYKKWMQTPANSPNYPDLLLNFKSYSTEFGNNDSGVIVNNISDHQMIYAYSTHQERAA